MATTRTNKFWYLASHDNCAWGNSHIRKFHQTEVITKSRNSPATTYFVKKWTKYNAHVFRQVLCGTSEWFKQIKIMEMRLIAAFVTSMQDQTNSTLADIPIFLPYTNPNSALRLLKVQLMQDAVLCMLCADDVKLQLVLSQIESTLASKIDLLQGALHIKQRCFPLSFQPNMHIQAFCCFNKTSRLCVTSLSPQVDVAESLSNISRPFSKDDALVFLSDFFKANFEMIKSIDGQFAPAPSTSETEYELEGMDTASSSNPADDCSELFWVKKNCKVYLLGVASYIITVLFNSDTPTHPMRSITTTLLESITSLSNFWYPQICKVIAINFRPNITLVESLSSHL